MEPDFIGRGWSFPIQLTAGGKIRMASGDEKIRQSIWMILSTAPGERQMRPTFGCGIHDLVSAPNTPALHGDMQIKVRDALVRWEPRIDLLDVRVETPPEAHNYLLIRIDYRVRTNNALFNMVYPFFINEGPA